MATESSFQFGIEVELLLGCRKKTYQSWKLLAKDVSKRLLKAGIANHINETNDKSRENYREWSIVQEVTIPSQPGKNLWGIELVSPVYPLNSSWGIDLDAIFDALADGGLTPYTSPHCSTHIHLSGTPAPLTADELGALARASLIYEAALDALVPHVRTGDAYWCQSNRASPALRGLDTAQCVGVVDRALGKGAGVRGVVEAMNLFPAASAYGRTHGKTKDFVRGKVYKWDFSGMLTGGRQTVEFRLPPGSVCAEDARGWVEVAVAFVAGSIGLAVAGGGGAAGLGYRNGGGDGSASLEELWAMLVGGAAALGWQDVTGLEGVFARRG